MADVNTGDDGGGGKHGKHQKKRAKKASTRIDMTPMVDLAFLLLTFFVLTSTFSKPKAMDINYPADPKDESEKQKINNALTFLLTDENRIFYYYGEFYPKDNKDGKVPTVLEETNFSKDGLHKLLLEKNKTTREEIAKLQESLKRKEIADTTFKRLSLAEKGKREALTVLIKSDDKAKYRNVIDLIDELNICLVGKYAVIEMMPSEYELLQAKNQTPNP
jgi:biopolymer transport protein ExbD